MEQIIDIDKKLFYLINNKWGNSFFDILMPFVRYPWFWAPLYIFLLVFLFTNFRKNKIWWIMLVVLTAILSDLISSSLIKEHIFRLRPCNEPSLADILHLRLSYRPQSSSFTSSHAFNHFALAAYFSNTLQKHIGKWGMLLYLWAFLVAYAQVYVGVHYPLDVLCGGLLGYGLGKLTSYTYNKNYILA